MNNLKTKNYLCLNSKDYGGNIGEGCTYRGRLAGVIVCIYLGEAYGETRVFCNAEDFILDPEEVS